MRPARWRRLDPGGATEEGGPIPEASGGAPGPGGLEFRLLADHLPVPVWRCRPDGGCDYVNQAWLAFTGRTFEQELGQGWLEGVHEDDRARVGATLEAARAARESFAIEFRLRRHDGRYRCVLDRGVPYDVEGSGALAGFACSTSDVHRHHRLRRALARSRRAMREREVLVAEIGHRAKNTIHLIGSLLALLARQVSAASVPAVREMARRVRAFGLAHEALSRGRGAGELELCGYLGDVARGLLELAEGRDLRLEVEGDLVLLPLGRAAPLGLIVNELVTNALKYGFPDGRSGTVRLGVRQHPDGTVEVSVADDGVGLPEEAWPPKGTASLGLPLVAGLARQAGATVRAERSFPGGGTRFVLLLPAHAAKAARPFAAPGPAPQPLTSA